MSNDISDLNKFVKATNCRKMSASAENCNDSLSSEPTEGNNAENMSNSMEKSMNFLGAMGYAQVNMTNPTIKRVQNSVDSFLEDPEYAKQHTETCDELVKRGYKLEDAIDVTDRIFDTLKTEDTYK